MPFPLAIRRAPRLVVALILAGAFSSCATTRAVISHDDGAIEYASHDDREHDSRRAASAVGLASYYAGEHDGRRTASGEIFDMQAMTAAHRTLPFGTRVRVTNLENGRQAVVRVNDRGPFRKGRIIDVSYAAARELGLVGRGVVKVRVDVL